RDGALDPQAHAMTRARFLAPAVLVAAGACWASKGDIRMLQDELRSMHATQVMGDVARRSQVDSLALTLHRTSSDLQRTIDPLRATAHGVPELRGRRRRPAEHCPDLRVRPEPTRRRLGIPPRRDALSENAAGSQRAIQARRGAVEAGQESRGQAITPTGHSRL